MAHMKMITTAVALSVLTAGCSGDGSEPSESTAVAAASTVSESALPAVDSEHPSAEDVTTLDGIAYASLTGDPTSGKSAFMQCRTCHVVDPGMNRVGPSLANIVGREACSVPGFRYTDANANSSIIWTEAKLFQFLEKPQRVIPKTKMIFAGMPDAQKRADVIAYLKNPS